AINPITGTNWEGVGVEPDIKTTADEALEKALPLAKEAAVRYAAEQRRKAEETVRPIRTALEKAEKLVAEGKTGEAQKVLEPALDKGLEQGVVTEMSVNMLGYASLQKNSVPLAIELFLFNVKRFPQSANVYDSYGEALMKAGRTEEAIRNYRKSLELDPTNENARTMIRRMTDRE
ncbi:MAG: tetratricopeptide repeat protein, partial [Ignavibacterium sp.]